MSDPWRVEPRDEIPDLEQATDRWHEVSQRIDADVLTRMLQIAALNQIDNDQT
jgi:hypothetical protein